MTLTNSSISYSQNSLLPLSIEQATIQPNSLELNATSIARSSAIAFIDKTIRDPQTLISGLPAGTEFHLIDSDDAVAQITQILLGRTNLSSLHLFSHGQAGALQLGSDWLDLQTLDRYGTQLRSWSRSLTEDADILIYGCNVAEGELGQTFIQQIANLTGADVAASDDLTGHAALKGDWSLEVEVGKIESAIAVNEAAIAAYQQALFILVPGYRDSFYASSYSAEITGLTIDLETNTLYFVDNSLQGSLFKIDSNREVSPVARAFTEGLFSEGSDLEFANGSVYATLSDRRLVQVNVNTFDITTPTTLPGGSGRDVGLARLGNKLFITSGFSEFNSNPGNILEYDLSNSTVSPKLSALPAGVSELEFDPFRNKFYFTARNPLNNQGEIYQADATTGAISRLASLPQGRGNFALDPTGAYLYVRDSQGQIVRVSTTDGSSTLFQVGLGGDGDLVFGRSSSGTGGSLYTTTVGGSIIEVSGFETPFVQRGDSGIYTRSRFSNLLGQSLAYDPATRSLYYADSFSRALYKVSSDGTVSTLTRNLPDHRGELQVANGALYLRSVDNSRSLVQINPNTGAFATLTGIRADAEAGLAANAGKLLIASSVVLQEYDVASGTNRFINMSLPTNTTTLEYDPVQNKYYAHGESGGFYAIDLTTGTYNLLANVPGSRGNFAIDPSGNYLYTKVGTEILRISTSSGETSVFQSGLLDSFNSDLEFGIASSGVGGSLYVADWGIEEISGFATPPLIPGTYASTGVLTHSVYADRLGSWIRSLAIDPTTGALYFASGDQQGVLGKVSRDRTVSSITNNFATSNNGSFSNSDLQFANNFIYTLLDNGNLVKINPSDGTSTTVANFSNFGFSAGLALESGKIIATSGTGFGAFQEYDLNTGSIQPALFGEYGGGYTLEYDPNKDRYYFFGFGGGLYSADPGTGRLFYIGNIPNFGGYSENFAIDPFGEYIYMRQNADIVRISTTSARVEVFFSPSRDAFGNTNYLTDWSTNGSSDMAFGASSSGNGYSLYMSDYDRIFEISGFPTAPINTAPSDTRVRLESWDGEATETPGNRANVPNQRRRESQKRSAKTLLVRCIGVVSPHQPQKIVHAPGQIAGDYHLSMQHELYIHRSSNSSELSSIGNHNALRLPISYLHDRSVENAGLQS